MKKLTTSRSVHPLASTFQRRSLMKASAAGAASIAFGALVTRRADARRGHGRPRFSRGYGPLSPKQDLVTGLPLIALPEGFRYLSYGWTGALMSDGKATPPMHDGMAAVARRGPIVALVRNHECSASALPRAEVPGGTYNADEAGGTSNLFFNLLTGGFHSAYTSLGGTIRNCAGGPTPWGTWLSCEETFHAWGSRADGFNHGYIFEVPGFGISEGKPVRAAGRFSHEAVAVDPRTGIVYETEDTGASGFYKYVQPGAGKHWRHNAAHSRLRDGGELYAMVVDGQSRKDLRGGFAEGTTFRVSWQKVADPEGRSGSVFESASEAAIISRGEGIWYDAGKLYFVSTDGGAAELGQVWEYDPRREELTLLFESQSTDEVDGPDNIAISPRGGILLCEDGAHDPQRLIGLSRKGEPFEFAANNLVLNPGDIDLIDSKFPGVKANYRGRAEGDFKGVEWAGATFYGDWLFVNIQTPGVTLAITGPWCKGPL